MIPRFREVVLFVIVLVSACSDESDALPVPKIVDPPREERSHAPVGQDMVNPRGDAFAPPENTGLTPPPPPPPPPQSSDFLDSVRKAPDDAGSGNRVLVLDAQGPREALFLIVVERFRAQEHFASRPICLVQTDMTMVATVAARFSDVHAEDACVWEGPGVVFAATGEPALWVHAMVHCADRACAAEGGATYGNLGAEGWGYRLRRTREGWTVEKLGIMWIS